jgi:hypothetical protein
MLYIAHNERRLHNALLRYIRAHQNLTTVVVLSARVCTYIYAHTEPFSDCLGPLLVSNSSLLRGCTHVIHLALA